MASLSLGGLSAQNILATQYMQMWKPVQPGFADVCFPLIPNLKRIQGTIPYIDPGEMLRYDDSPLGDLAPVPEITVDWQSNSFVMKRWAESIPYSQNTIEEGQALGGVFANLPLRYAKILRIRFELARQLRAVVEIENNATAGSLSGSLWSAGSGVTIKKDIDDWVSLIRLANGVEPNWLFISEKVAKIMFRDPTFVAFLNKQTTMAIEKRAVKIDVLKDYLEIPNIFIDKGVYQTSIEGQTAGTLTDILGNLAVVCYVEPLSSDSGFGHGMTMRKYIKATTGTLSNNRKGFYTDLEIYEVPKILQAASIIQTTVVA